MKTPPPAGLFDALFTTDAMRAVFDPRARLQHMLDVEAALARAEARAGTISRAAADAVQTQCLAERFDIEAIARATAAAGNPVIPMVKELTALVAGSDPEAAHVVHRGATSQDVMDTALVLELRAALDLIESDLARLAAGLAKLARAHKRTPLAGRTWLQQAVPVTFGLKAAGWLSAIARDRVRLHDLRARALALQFGGAAGTLAALGTQGLAVAAALADELQLTLPDVPWHTARDRLVEVAAALGLLVGTLGKIARDVSLMMQTEVGELSEAHASGEGGSSTMPQKQNPVGAAIALAAAVRVPSLVSTMLSAMVQEHERGLGGWHAEWETLPQICLLAAGALARVAQTIEGLAVGAERMRENLSAAQGLVMAEAVSAALAEHIGKAAAHEMVAQASRRAIQERRELREALAADPQVRQHLSSSALAALFEPTSYLGIAETLIDRALAADKTGE